MLIKMSAKIRLDMKQFEYDPERLIEEVKKRPGIWNYNNVNYKSMATRYELWNELVHEILQPDAKVTKSEVRELVLQLQKKWKSLKDAYNKYLQNPYKSKRPYIYHKQLQFLANKNETLDSSGTFEEPPESDDTQWRPKKRKKTVSVKNESSTEEDSDDGKNESAEYLDEDPDFLNDYSGPSSSKQARTTKPEIAFACVDSFPKNEGEDCDKMFLLSLLPHLKSIPEEYRLDAKMKVLDVLKKANVKHSFQQL